MHSAIAKNYYTCTLSAISNVAHEAGAVETSLSVNALCTLMTVGYIVTQTLVNICTRKQNCSMLP